VRSWPLRPDPAQCRDIRTRFFTGVRVYNAVLGEFIGRSRTVKADPAWQAARELPRRTATERKYRGAAFRAVEQAHGFTVDAAQSYASSLRKSWVREHLPAQETQNLGARAFDAVGLVAPRPERQTAVQEHPPRSAFAGRQGRPWRAATQDRCRGAAGRVAVEGRVRHTDRRTRPQWPAGQRTAD
jgi:hypothetical protein